MSGRGARVIARTLWASGLTSVARWIVAARGRFVIELHGVPRRVYAEIPPAMRPSLSEADLVKILAWLSRRFHFLSPLEFLETDRPGILLTFDDGFANNHDVVVPLLEKFGAPAIFFVTTQHLGTNGRWLPSAVDAARAGWGEPNEVPSDVARDVFDGMDENQIRACAATGLVTIGAHAVSHPKRTTLDDDELEREITLSKEMMEEVSGVPVDLFAYPFGDADERVARAVAAAGFRAAFVEERLPIEPVYLGIPRVGLHSAMPWYLATKLSGLHDRPLAGAVFSS